MNPRVAISWSIASPIAAGALGLTLHRQWFSAIILIVAGLWMLSAVHMALKPHNPSTTLAQYFAGLACCGMFAYLREPFLASPLLLLGVGLVAGSFFGKISRGRVGRRIGIQGHRGEELKSGWHLKFPWQQIEQGRFVWEFHKGTIYKPTNDEL